MDNIFKELKKERVCQHRLLYLVKIFFKKEGGKKDSKKQKEFITNESIFQKIVKEVLQALKKNGIPRRKYAQSNEY